MSPRSLTALLIVAILPSCAPLPSSKERTLADACGDYAKALNVQARRNSIGLLSGEMQDRVDSIDVVVGPICDGSDPAGGHSAALATVEAALVALREPMEEDDEP